MNCCVCPCSTSTQQVRPLQDLNRKPIHRSKFSIEEDLLLRQLASTEFVDWNEVSKALKRFSPRQCKERWFSYLHPNINNGPWTETEDRILIEKHKIFGPKWTIICKFLPSRTDMGIKNRYRLLQRASQKTEIKREKRTFDEVFPTEPKFLMKEIIEFFDYVIGDNNNGVCLACDFFGTC